jgi:hypothetical protein
MKERRNNEMNMYNMNARTMKVEIANRGAPASARPDMRVTANSNIANAATASIPYAQKLNFARMSFYWR